MEKSSALRSVLIGKKKVSDKILTEKYIGMYVPIDVFNLLMEEEKTSNGAHLFRIMYDIYLKSKGL